MKAMERDLICRICNNGSQSHPSAMTLVKIIKLIFFALTIELASVANADETSVDFSMNCNLIEGEGHTAPRLSGQKLKSFREKAANTLTHFSCRRGTDHPAELCHLNNKRSLDA